MAFSAGQHDPYWYESSIGQRFIIRMLNPNNEIESVTFQSPEYQKIDDVHVKYKNGCNHYYQIKHSRVGKTLTFRDLIYTKDRRDSLLKGLAKEWEQAYIDGKNPKIILLTNRELGDQKAEIKVRNNTIQIPGLRTFYTELTSLLPNIDNIEELNIDGAKEFISHLEFLGEKVLEFLRNFKIIADQPELHEIEKELILNIKDTFSIDDIQAKEILSSLDNALRRWTTSPSKEVKIEEIWEILRIKNKDNLDCNYVPTPAPFFESRNEFAKEIIRELELGNKRVVFLEGEPGIGKSAIVSKIAHNSKEYITLKYYTFKPITPSDNEIPVDFGETAKPEVFWGELLNQLREIFKGKLYQYKIPIRNEFLNVKQLRKNVMRLTKELAVIKGKRVIISIDGIDHAARMNKDNTFLNTLPGPDSIDPKICFFIAGQPIESYDKYPVWLNKNNDEKISFFNVPRLDVNDIILLIRDIHSENNFNYKNAAEIIKDYSSGNTLSVIYSVREISNVADLSKLRRRLEERHLSDNLIYYYEGIWEFTFRKLKINHIDIDINLAGLISLIKVPFNEHLLSNVLNEYNLNEGLWTNILMHLTPLILKRDEKYTILHNDFRVFLTGKLNKHQAILEKIANNLYEYYYITEEYKKYKHEELIRLKSISKKKDEITTIVNDDFIIEGAAIKRPISEMKEQYKIALKNAIYSKNKDLLFTQYLAGLTLYKYENILFLLNNNSYEFIDKIPESNIYISELKIPPIDKWEIADINQLFDIVLDLIYSGEIERGNDLYNSWIGDFNPITLINKIAPEYFEVKKRNNNIDNIKLLIQKWGKISYYLGYISLSNNEDDKFADLYTSYSKGFLRESAQVSNLYKWKITLRSLQIYYYNDIEYCLDYLTKQSDWKKLFVILRFLRNKIENYPNIIKLKVLLFSVIMNKDVVINYYKSKLIENLFEYNADQSNFHLESNHLAISFIAGALLFEYDISIILSKIHENVKVLRDEHRYNFSKLLSILCHLGRLWTTIFVKGNYKKYYSEYQYSCIVTNLLILLNNQYSLQYNIREYFGDILNLIIKISENLDEEYKKITHTKIINYVSFYPFDSSIEPIWNYLVDCSEIDLLKRWFNKIVGENGKVWTLHIEEREEIIKRFSELATKAELQIDVDYAKKRYSNCMISFTNNKEYNIKYPLKWFELASSKNSYLWKSSGMGLYSISEYCNVVGDNSYHNRVLDSLFDSATRSGIDDLYKLTEASEYYFQDSDIIINALYELIKNSEFSNEQLKGFWAFVIGTQRWQIPEEQSKIIDFRENLLNKIDDNTITELEETTPTEWFIEKPERKETNNYRKKSITEDEILNCTYEELIEVISNHTEYFSYISDFLKIYPVIINKIKGENPAMLNGIIKLFIDNIVLIQYEMGSYLYEEALMVLLQYINEEKVWKILITKYEANKIGVDGLDLFCRALYFNDNHKICEEKTNSIINTMKKWITGNYKYPVKKYELNLDDVAINKLNSWNEFILIYLIKRIESKTCSFIEVSLHGIWLLISTDKSLFQYIQTHWNDFDSLTKEYLLKLFEVYIYKYPRHFSLIEEVVYMSYKGDDIKLKFLAWIILEINKRVNNEDFESMKFNKPSNYDILSKLNNYSSTLIYNNGYQDELGRGNLGFSIIHSNIEYINKITQMNCSDIEYRLSDYIEKFPLEEQKKTNLMENHVSDFILNDSIAFSRYQEILGLDNYNGRWNHIPNIKMEQVFNTGDDPFILHKTATISDKCDNWLYDEALDNAIRQDTIKNDLVKLLEIHLNKDEIILGGTVTTFSADTTIEFCYLSYISKGIIIQKISPSLSYNYKFNTQYYDQSYIKSNENDVIQLTMITSFINKIIGSNPLIFPNNIFHYYGIRPNPFNPTEWIDEDGNIAIYYERFSFPVRNIYPLDRYNHQPYLGILKIKKSLFDKLEEESKSKIMYHDILRKSNHHK